MLLTMPDPIPVNAIAARAWEEQHTRPSEAQRLALEAMAQAQAQGDARSAAWAQMTLAYLDLRQESYREARPLLQEAVLVFRDHADTRGHILATNGLARLAMIEGEIEAALAVFRANLREDGGSLSPLDRFYTLNGIAGCLAALGDTPQALAHLFEALEALRSIDAKPQMATLLTNLGTELVAVGDLQEARHTLEEAADLAKALDRPRLRLEIEASLAECLVYLGQAAQALPLARRLMRSSEALGAASREGNVYTSAALALLAGGKSAEANDALACAEELAIKHDSPDGRIWVLALRGMNHARRGERGQAIARLEEARRAFNSSTPLRLRALVLEKLAAFLAEAGRHKEAYELHRAFFAVYEERLGLATRARYHAVQLRHELNRLRWERDRAREEALRDPLTGLHNRRYLDSVLAELLAVFARSQQPLTLAIIDLDHFKAINDTAGHAFGDEVLRVLGQLLTQSTRAGDAVCRIGGEEFCLVFADSAPADAKRRLENLLAQLHARSICWGETERSGITFSAGLAAYPEDGASGAVLLEAADRALYHAKHEGRAKVVFLPRMGGRPPATARGPRKQGGHSRARSGGA